MRKEPINILFKIIGGKPAPKGDNVFTDYGTPFIKMKDLGRAHASNNLVEIDQYVSEITAKKNKLNIVKKGSILLPRSGSVALNHRAVLGVDAYMVSHICALEVINKKLINNIYAYYYLRTIKLDRITKKTTGLDAITFEDLGKIKIPLPPLDDQKRIAHLLGKVEGMIARRKQHLQQLDELLKSVFLEMFSPVNPEFKNWPVCEIKDLAANHKGSMRTGPFGSNLLHSEFVEDGEIAVLGIDNAVQNKFAWDERRYITKEKYKELENYTIYPGDVIITIMGTVGRSAVIPEDISLAINTKHLAAITLNRDLANPVFLSFSIHSSPYIINQFKSKNRGAIMSGLNLTLIKETKLNRPPIELQNQFATIVTKVESLKARYQSSLSHLENLYGALSQKAFKGELDLGRVPLPVAEKQIEISLQDLPLNSAIVSKDFIKTMEIFGKQINETLRIPAELINQHTRGIRRINESINLVSKSFSRMIPDSLVQSLTQMNRLTAEAIKPIKLNTGFIQQMNDVYKTMNKALESPLMKELIQKASEILEPWSEEYICEKIKTEFESKHFTIQDVLDLTAIQYEVSSSYDPYQVIRPINGKKNDVIGLKDLFERALSNNYKCHMRVEQVYEEIENKDFKQVLLKVVA